MSTMLLELVREMVQANLELLHRIPAVRQRASERLADLWQEARGCLPLATRDRLDGCVSRLVQAQTVTCSCGKTRTRHQFDALPLPANGVGRWALVDDEPAMICRQCSCGTMWTRPERACEQLAYERALEASLDKPHHGDVDAMPTHFEVRLHWGDAMLTALDAVEAGQ